MAVQFNAATDPYTGTGVTGNTVTIVGWFSLVSNLGTFQALCSLGAQGASGVAVVADSAPVLNIYDSTGANISLGTTLTIGTWYKFAVVCSGTSWTLYQAPQGSALVSNAQTRTATASPSAVYIGDDGTGAWSNSQVADFKVYSAALTQTEIEAELAAFAPTRTANLVRYHPFHVAELTDYSGNSNTLTAGSTNPTTATDPTEPVAGGGGGSQQLTTSNLYPTSNTTTGSTWTNTTNANGSTTGNVATLTAATGTQGSLLAAGYGVQAAIGAQPQSVDSVSCTVNAYVGTTTRWSSVTVQLYDGASNPIGTAQSYTLSATTTNSQTLTFTGANAPTWAQCADLRVNLVAVRTGAQSNTFNVDTVGPLTVTYTTAPVTGPPRRPRLVPQAVSRASVW